MTASSAAPPPGDAGRTALYGLGAGLGFALLSYICIEVPRAFGQVSPIWLSNGYAVAWLLSTAGRRWPGLLIGCLIGGLVAGAHAGDTPLINVVMVACNLLQIFACAWGVRHWAGRDIDLGRPRDMMVFAIIGGGVAPVLTGLVAAGLHTLLRGGDLASNMVIWVLGDVLGLLTLTPCLLALVRLKTYLRERPPSWSGAAALALLAAISIGVFAQSTYPLLFIVPPAMLLVAWRLEVLGAALAAGLVATIAVLFPLAGRGPIMLMDSAPATEAMVLQLFLAVAIFISLPVASLQRHRQQILQQMVAANLAAARSEARFRLLADTAQDIIVQTSLDGRIQYVSSACETLLGYTVEEFTGSASSMIVHPDDMDAVRNVVAPLLLAIKSGASIKLASVEYRARRKDGKEIWLESRPALARDPVTGAATGITDIVRDISDRKAMEQQLREARTEAETAAAVKGEFLANMSHELRTPLTSVLGFARLIDDQPELSSDTRRYVSRVLSGGRSLLATINDILDFSKLEAGQLELQPESVSPVELVSESLDLFSLDAGAKGLTLRAKGLDALPDRLWLDPNRVRQVLLNLIGNSLKFTEAGAVTVSADYDAERERLNFAIADTGPGIAPEAMALLFRRFSQIDAAITRKHGGTGLGLAICKGLVEAMGGEIGVESRLGQGASFTFHIVAKAVAKTQTVAAAPLPPLPAGCRVLVVDDNPANRELATAILTALGAEVEEAADGEEGVRAAKARAFDVILMDLRMPLLDGVQAAGQIRAGGGPNAAIPIIAFSADARPGGLDGPAEIFDGAVHKPMTVGGLVTAITAALDRPSGLRLQPQD